MNDNPEEIPASRSWRDIPQAVKPRAMSAEGRRRQTGHVVRVAFAAVFAAAVVAGAAEFYLVQRGQSFLISKFAGARPLAPLEVSNTDGVLDAAWVERTLALPPGSTLVTVDHRALRSRLMAASDQILSVAVSKSFPDRLLIELTERSPIARLRTPEGMLLVARDGVAWPGYGYAPAFLETLPWLNVASVQREADGGFAPIPQMNVAADLLGRAQLTVPAIYATWRVVDLTRLESDGEIEIRSSEARRIVFGTRRDFYTQLSWLDYLWDQSGPAFESINVALGPRVVVTYDKAGAMRTPARRPDPFRERGPAPLLPAFPDFASQFPATRAL